MSAFKFRPAGPIGEYYVMHDGVELGIVRKWERRYNLRRVIVSRGWRARTPDGESLYHADGYTGDTRQAAAEALLKYTEAKAA